MPRVGVYNSVIADDANSDFIGGAFNTKHQHASSLRAARTNTLRDTDPRQTAQALRCLDASSEAKRITGDCIGTGENQESMQQLSSDAISCVTYPEQTCSTSLQHYDNIVHLSYSWDSESPLSDY